jgi:hypothetical protein
MNHSIENIKSAMEEVSLVMKICENIHKVLAQGLGDRILAVRVLPYSITHM